MRVLLAQDRAENRLLDLTGQQNDGLEHEKAPSPFGLLDRGNVDGWLSIWLGRWGGLSPRLEIAQIGRRLILFGRHQQPVGAQHVALTSDTHMLVLLDAGRVAPDRASFAGAPVALGHRPWTREGMVDQSDLVVQNVSVGGIAEETLLDDALIVRMQRNSARVERAQALEAARLDHERIVETIALCFDPTADGITGDRRLACVPKAAAVREDAPVLIQ